MATIDLDGRGIRELAMDRDQLWGIAGTMADSDQKSRLWHVDSRKLQSGARMSHVGTVDRRLPPTSEGLMVDGQAGQALIITDGDLDKENDRCKQDSGLLLVPLPH